MLGPIVLASAAPVAHAGVCYPWYCPNPSPPPVVTAFGSDDFNRPDGSLGPNWIPKGPGVPYIQNGELSGAGLPSDPQSYAFWATPSPGDFQDSKAMVRWDGRNPAHSCFGPVVRADAGNPSFGQPGTEGVMFWATDDLMGISYRNTAGTIVGASGTQRFTSTSKFAEGAVMELKVTAGTNGNDIYTAYVGGRQVMQGTVPTSAVPRAAHSVGLGEQDDSAVSGGGESPASLDDWVGAYLH